MVLHELIEILDAMLPVAVKEHHEFVALCQRHREPGAERFQIPEVHRMVDDITPSRFEECAAAVKATIVDEEYVAVRSAPRKLCSHYCYGIRFIIYWDNNETAI